MIYTVTLNPALDKTVEIPNLTVDSVNRITALRTDPGGKGINVTKVIDKLGGRSVALGILGGHTGGAIRQALEQMGLETDFLFVEGETRTNLKVIDPVNHTNTDLNEPGLTVNQQVLDTLLERLTGRIQPGDIVVLSGSLPKGAPRDTYGRWVARCKEAGAKVFLDADGDLLAAGLREGPYLVKPNHVELAGLLGRSLETVEELVQAARTLLDQGIEKVVVSMGGRGALYITRDQVIRAQGLKVPVGSTVGAGDSVVAALAVAEEAGMSLEEAARLSTATGAANVMCSGTQAAEYSVVKELLGRVELQELSL